MAGFSSLMASPFITVPLLALFVVLRCYRSVKRGRRPEAPVMTLEESVTHTRIPVLYWENSIGRSKSCDISLPDPAISRDHAVLMRREQGWFVIDTGSKSGTRVNGKKIAPSQRAPISPGDTVSMGQTQLIFRTAENSDVKKRRFFSGEGKRAPGPFAAFFVTMVIHLFMAIQCCFAPIEEGKSFSVLPLMLLGVVYLMEIFFYLFSIHGLGRVSFEVETVALLFSGIGIFLLAGDSMDVAITQLVALFGGILVFCILIWFMGDLDRVSKWRFPLALCAVGLLAATLIVGTSLNGSKNWIFIGPISIQPSELAKIVFIFAGAATLDKLQTRRNLTEFIVLAALCGGCLVLMRDLGSCQSPENAFLLNLGLETLALRMERHCSNALAVAQFLEKDPRVAWVNYPDLPSSSQYELAKKYMPHGTCGVVSFGVKGGREAATKFMDGLNMASVVTHVADLRTCCLHPASTTHRQMTDEQLEEAGVPADLIRLSVGIENPQDILADIDQALEKAAH